MEYLALLGRIGSIIQGIKLLAKEPDGASLTLDPIKGIRVGRNAYTLTGDSNGLKLVKE